MSQQGKVQLVFTIVATPDKVAEGDRIFDVHAKWMAESHHREGEKALLQYNVSKAPELVNPLDPSAGTTGNTCFVLAEVYESEAGIADHFERAVSDWAEFGDFVAWMEACQVTIVPSAKIIHSLW
jgi:hypothetical protein